MYAGDAMGRLSQDSGQATGMSGTRPIRVWPVGCGDCRDVPLTFIFDPTIWVRRLWSWAGACDHTGSLAVGRRVTVHASHCSSLSTQSLPTSFFLRSPPLPLPSPPYSLRSSLPLIHPSSISSTSLRPELPGGRFSQSSPPLISCPCPHPVVLGDAR